MSGGEFDLAMPWWEFALRGVAVYLTVLLMLRLTGKRAFGDLSTFDIGLLMLVGGSLRTAIIGKDPSVLGPLIAVAAILLTDKVIGWMSARSHQFNRCIEGEPAILARDGRRDREALRRHNVPEAEFERELHRAGLEDESSVTPCKPGAER